MGKMPTKAKRGKRRWIGLEFKGIEIGRETALDKAKDFLGVEKIRLFDLLRDNDDLESPKESWRLNMMIWVSSRRGLRV